MRAFVIQQFGQPGEVEDRPMPRVEPGEVLVRVRAAGLNAMDPIIASGALRQMMEHRLPLIPGLDVSGTVEAVGDGVTGWSVGDEVFGRSTKPYFGEGTLAEFMTTSADSLVRRPAGLSDTEAAALPTAGSTAAALVEAVRPRAGETVVIIGAAGGVGGYATQLAARTGARVLGATSAASADHVRQLGAAAVLDYGAGDLVDQVHAVAPDGAEALIDLHSDQAGLNRLLGMVRRGGRVASPLRAVDAEALAERGLTGENVGADPTKVGELGELAASGELRVPVTRTFTLEQAGDAIAEQGTHRAPGKLVVVIDGRQVGR